MVTVYIIHIIHIKTKNNLTSVDIDELFPGHNDRSKRVYVTRTGR